MLTWDLQYDMEETLPEHGNLFVSLISGGCAGISVEVSLFPLDTLKTRLQAEGGIWKSGGFKNIYAGLAPVAVGSAPNAALFFVTYDIVKLAARRLHEKGFRIDEHDPKVHMVAASLGEITSCLVQVPVEIVKQRQQANCAEYSSSKAVIKQILKREGWQGFYRGYTTTVLREIPLCIIQFPIWERLKSEWARQQNQDVEAWQSAVCGSVASGFGAAVTTPFDVAKTRIMLAKSESEMATKESLKFAIGVIYKEKGIKGLFAGLIPRTLWMSIGGAVFFGVYEKVKILSTSLIMKND